MAVQLGACCFSNPQIPVWCCVRCTSLVLVNAGCQILHFLICLRNQPEIYSGTTQRKLVSQTLWIFGCTLILFYRKPSQMDPRIRHITLIYMFLDLESTDYHQKGCYLNFQAHFVWILQDFSFLNWTNPVIWVQNFLPFQQQIPLWIGMYDENSN